MIDVIFVLSMALVTFIPRVLPMALASRLRLPPKVEQALNYVPIAVLTVIITQTIAFSDGQLNVNSNNPYLWASAVALIVALLQKRLFVTILCGLITYSIIKIGLLG